MRRSRVYSMAHSILEDVIKSSIHSIQGIGRDVEVCGERQQCPRVLKKFYILEHSNWHLYTDLK